MTHYADGKVKQEMHQLMNETHQMDQSQRGEIEIIVQWICKKQELKQGLFSKFINIGDGEEVI